MDIPGSQKRAYDDAFAAFLICTDEKEVLGARIAQGIRERKAPSLLDIGAGGGEVASTLAPLVGRYCAVEQNPVYAAALRKRGLAVHEASFPCALGGQFAVVLSCHSLPRYAAEYEVFLQKAWDYVVPGGVLLVIVHQVIPSEWHDLLVACDLSVEESDFSRTEGIIAYLSAFGETQTETLTSFVSSSLRQWVLSALSFVYSSGKLAKIAEFEEHFPAIMRHLKKNHHDGREYSFPFQHLFIKVRKE